VTSLTLARSRSSRSSDHRPYHLYRIAFHRRYLVPLFQAPSHAALRVADLATICLLEPVCSLPATQSDILGIFQCVQDHAMALLSSSPLLASPLVSYVNQAAAFRSGPALHSPKCEEWKALQNTTTACRRKSRA
jgi:hypothetical protein